MVFFIFSAAASQLTTFLPPFLSLFQTPSPHKVKQFHAYFLLNNQTSLIFRGEKYGPEEIPDNPTSEFLAVQRLEIQFYWISNPLSIVLLCSLIIPVKLCPVQVWVYG